MDDSKLVRPVVYNTSLTGKTWFSPDVFELRVRKPPVFSFLPGQKVLLSLAGVQREYTITFSTSEELVFCIKHIHGGRLTELLSQAPLGRTIMISEAYGFFVYRTGPSVFVGTGTGIAPFVAFAKSGVRDYILLQGAASEEQLYYREILNHAARLYIPCITSSASPASAKSHFRGRVTGYLKEKLAAGKYDFYLCGGREMVRDAMLIVDRKFPGCRVYTESFY